MNAEKLRVQIPEIKRQGRGGGEGKLEQMQHLAGFVLKIRCLQEAGLFIQVFSLPVNNCNCLVTSWSTIVKLWHAVPSTAQQKHLWVWNVTVFAGLCSLLSWRKDASDFMCCAMSACGHGQCGKRWHHQPHGNYGRASVSCIGCCPALSPEPASSPAPLSSKSVLFLRVQPCLFLNHV